MSSDRNSEVGEPEAKKIKLSFDIQENLYEEGELTENDDEQMIDEDNIDLRSIDNFGGVSSNVSKFQVPDTVIEHCGDEGMEVVDDSGVLNTSIGSFDFQVLDDLSDAEKEEDAHDNGNENKDEEDDDDDEEDEIDEQEIDAMLDDGMPAMPKAKCKFGKETLNTKLLLPFGDEDFLFPKVGEKTLLVERGKNPFDILPEGWVVISHSSGMPVYLHKQSRVCTLSRPYFLGPGSVRKHDIPVSAVPCLQYKRALQDGGCLLNHDSIGNQEKEKIRSTQVNHSNEGAHHIDDTLIANVESEEVPFMMDGAEVNDTNPSSSQANLISTPNIPITSEVSVPLESIPSDHLNHFSGRVKVQSAEEHRRINSLDPAAFREYCQKLFEFKTITIRRFQRWKDRRKHNTILKRAVRPTLPPTTKLITCQLQNDKGFQMKKKEFVLNPAGKSAVCILHEYAQHAMKVQPKYKFTELENSQTPYSATVIINDIHYGTGYASSKKLAKLEAARVTLDILIPEINKDENDKKKDANPCHDLSFFDTVKIEDPGLLDLCTIAGHPSPFQILNECLQRNFGMGDTQPKMDLKTLKHQKSEFTMRVGKHEAKVICKNKREGRQQASQAILQLLHPHIKMWGSLLRLYFKANEIQEKREEEHSVTMLQTKAKPNKAILNKLRQEMTKLYMRRDTYSANVTQKFHLNGHEIRSAELGSVEL